MSNGVLVAGIGNLFLTDDGFGCEVARRLAGGPMPEGVRVVDYGIRGMHLAYDLLNGYDALVVVDALPGKGSPGDLTVLEVGPDDLGEGELDAHGMAPVSVLASLGQLGGALPPTYVVGCQPADVGEGDRPDPRSGRRRRPCRGARTPRARRTAGPQGGTTCGAQSCLRGSTSQQICPKEERGPAMRTIGIITTGFVGLAALLGAAIGIRSVPDVKRYLRIRSM